MTSRTRPRISAATAIEVEPVTAAAPATQTDPHRGSGAPGGTERTVLIGTGATLGELAALLAVHAPGSTYAGAIVLDGGSPDVPTLRVLGGAEALRELHALHGFDSAIVCIPASRGDERARVLSRLAQLGISARVATPAVDLLGAGPVAPEAAGESGVSTWRAAPTIDLGALIGRTPIGLDRAAVARVLAGKRVLITGAGGSIGSHLAHVVAEFGPASIILMERAENALFEVDRQLARRFPAVPRHAVLHDVVDAMQTARHLMALRPEVVFHAAAHKHVPLMEDHPAHAVANNVMGTKAIADASVACGAERFVMISSDKAVNPTSVMGATKRLAELYVRWLGTSQERTRMSMVRFGNVLGSACSVLTIWSTQIAEGGPITVTDPRMTRYFMTIPEAAGLVIASTTLEDQPSGAVYVLDMGEPVKIVELAKRFIEAHGMTARLVGADGGARAPGAPVMDIQVTGARPGEKVHEELAYAAENLMPTAHAGIRAWSGLAQTAAGETHSDALKLSGTRVARMLEDLRSACATNDPARVIEAIHRHVPEMVRRRRAAA